MTVEMSGLGRGWGTGPRPGGGRAQELSGASPNDMTLLLVFHFHCPVHHFNLGRRIPGFDYGPDGFGTGLTPLHLSDDGEGGTFHFHDPPPPYTAYKYPDIDQPDDPPPPYEASINPDSMFYDPAGASPTGSGGGRHQPRGLQGQSLRGPPQHTGLCTLLPPRPPLVSLVLPLRWNRRLWWSGCSQGCRCK